ncbi:class I SAM-dependent methyltransferase [Clostridium oryzae]|uniref:Ubiquinone/menaquinone biosynthesis C-methyltransferase UbiE n=1 Tax=Clostridium oryzae TaxID=1450648 RepID=A0A1V4IEM1_9CLOT|nr:class I SAM-dependent methyltransferase [Clostridium oryzae]OPJ58458.1 ubiquinone/menaquinone biosynthesis C-methyltransferase UbiE [Clostridium oryzae]
MYHQKENWNKIYEEVIDIKPKYDLWLDKYQDILAKSKDTPIVDLGCGFGNDTLYLKERGYEVISCDFSEQALIRLVSFIKDLNTICFDMTDGLPFENDSTKVIISDLSLHYFSWDKTKEIIKEIKRVLADEGTLLCRVNSTNDINYGAGQGIEIEKNFYDIDGELKRFFDEASLRELFKEWDIKFIKETEMDRYKMKKVVWEIAVKKV